MVDCLNGLLNPEDEPFDQILFDNEQKSKNNLCY